MNQQEQVEAIFDRISVLNPCQRLATGVTILSVEAVMYAECSKEFDDSMRDRFGPNWKEDEKSHMATAAAFLNHLVALAAQKATVEA